MSPICLFHCSGDWLSWFGKKTPCLLRSVHTHWRLLLIISWSAQVSVCQTMRFLQLAHKLPPLDNVKLFPAQGWALQAGPSDIVWGWKCLIFSLGELWSMVMPGGFPKPSHCLQVPPRDKFVLTLALELIWSEIAAVVSLPRSGCFWLRTLPGPLMSDWCLSREVKHMSDNCCLKSTY